MNPKYGSQLKKVRAYYGMTQIEVAQKAGIAINSLRRYESDERTPTMDVLEKIAGAYGITVAQLLWSQKFDLQLFAEGPEQAIKRALDKLNDAGQEKAVERVEELTEIPKYQRDPDEE